MSQGRDSLRATDMIYMFPFNGMIQPECCPCVTCATVPCCSLTDPQWTSSDEHTCSHMKTTSPYGYAGSLRGTCPASAQTSNSHSETQISSLELSLSCHHVVRLRHKAWYLDTRGFILKTIQWHIHTGSWSLVNCWREALTRHYIRCS